MWLLRKLESSSHKISAMKVLGLAESENLPTNVEKHNNLADTSVDTVVNSPMEARTQQRRGKNLARRGM